ncbi:hypothetical protein B4Q13_24530, partial [Lacticaseibacillus rhamnosus]
AAVERENAPEAQAAGVAPGDRQRIDEAVNDPRSYPEKDERPESRQLEPLPQDRVPLFLSDYDQQYEEEYNDQPQYTFGSKLPKSYTVRILSGALAVSAAAAIVGLFMMEGTRSVLVDAKASLASVARWNTSPGKRRPTPIGPRPPRVGTPPPSPRTPPSTSGWRRTRRRRTPA